MIVGASRAVAFVALLPVTLVLLPFVAPTLCMRWYLMGMLVAAGGLLGHAAMTRPVPRHAKAHVQLRNISAAMMHYQLDHPACPGSLAPLVEEGLLRRGAERDPWGREIEVRCAGDGIDLRSAGPDRRFRTADDIVIIDGDVLDEMRSFEPAPAPPRAASAPVPP